MVHASKGPELDDFLALIDAFNRRGVEPTAWRVEVRAGDRSLERLVADRPGDLVVLAGRNDRKPATIRRLHDAGLHVLADKPWMAGPEGLDDLRHALAAGPLAVEMMTGPHEITGSVATRLVGDDAVFGGFVDGAGEPAIEITSVDHLEKTVNGWPHRRPPWYFDVRVQGDGIADIPTHMVDQAQRLVRAATAGASEGGLPLELLEARTWNTPVPRALFERITGLAEFPPALAAAVTGSELAYRSNAALAFRAGGVRVALDTRWEPSAPPGGGDHHRTVLRGARSLIRIEQGPTTAFRRRLSIEPRDAAAPGAGRVQAALERALARWPDAPGLALAPTAAGVGPGGAVHELPQCRPRAPLRRGPGRVPGARRARRAARAPGRRHPRKVRAARPGRGPGPWALRRLRTSEKRGHDRRRGRIVRTGDARSRRGDPRRADRARGDLDALTPDDHRAGGSVPRRRQARDRAPRATGGAGPGMQVLDVGGGFGGPARTLAVEFGCHVTTVDLTASYVRAAQALTARMRPRRPGDATTSATRWRCPSTAPSTWCGRQNSGMNIADKERLYAGFHRVLRPGGLLALQEPMAGPVRPCSTR